MEEYARLCCLAVEDVYGSFLAEIFQHLAQQGRLSVNQVAQKCRLPLRQVKAGIAALIQLRLVYQHTTPDGSSTYQANTHSAYNLVRVGQLVELAARRYGQAAAKVMEHLAILGYATPDELEAHVSGDGHFANPQEPAASANGHLQNGATPDVDQKSRERFRTALRCLIDDRFIMSVRDAHFQSPFDARQEVERHFRHLGVMPSAKGKKVQSEIDHRVDVELESRMDGTISSNSVLQFLEHRERSQENSMYSQSVPILCIDHSNLVMSTRNERLATAVENRFGREAAQVMRAACLQVDVDAGPVKRRDDTSALIHRLNTSKISNDLSEEDKLVGQNGDSGGRNWPSEGRLVNGHRDQLVNGAMHNRQIESQLAVLAEGPFNFLSQDASGNQWFLHRTRLNHFLRDEELMRLMGESLDGPALRIVRMLMDKGKLDEKTLQEIGLLGAKDLRQCLAQLQMLGFLELQEVPREPQRQPNRTIFLWFYDPERVRKLFLGRLYKTMARLFQRLRLERERLASTLSKVERTDVQGSEAEMLAPAELQVLLQWRRKEAWFMAEINRLDESVMILRDL
ncbi:DNA-directed RNA polymerase III subunit rpc3 [Exophiala dermatitidis]